MCKNASCSKKLCYDALVGGAPEIYGSHRLCVYVCLSVFPRFYAMAEKFVLRSAM